MQALWRQQHTRHEDKPALQQRQQRLEQDLSAARSQLEALRQQHELSSLQLYNTNEKVGCLLRTPLSQHCVGHLLQECSRILLIQTPKGLEICSNKTVDEW